MVVSESNKKIDHQDTSPTENFVEPFSFSERCMQPCSNAARVAAMIAIGALIGGAVGTGLGMAFGGVAIAGIIVPVALGPWMGTFAAIGAMAALFLIYCCDQRCCLTDA